MNQTSHQNTNPTTQQLLEKRQKLKRISHILDDAFVIPVINYRIGWDAIIGFIPVLGDAVGFILGAYFIIEAKRLKLPFSSILKILFNILFEFLIGMIPVFGDLFDISWRANKKNYDIIDKQIARQLKERGITSKDSSPPLVPENLKQHSENKLQALWLILAAIVTIYLFITFPDAPLNAYEYLNNWKN